MEIAVRRDPSFNGATLGVMAVDGLFECYTLEDEVREIPGQPVSAWKVQDRTAIPCGRYRVTLTYSPHFKRIMPLLNGVEGFTAVRIHWGNDAADTDGCILVGKVKEGNLIYQSRAAFDALYPRIEAAINAGQEVYITIL